MRKKFYRAIMICISLMLILSMTFVFTGCSEESSEPAEEQANTASEETEVVQESIGSGQTYDFPQCGFGFELPESVKLTKGFVDAKDVGEIKYNGGISYGFPTYWCCTEEEFKIRLMQMQVIPARGDLSLSYVPAAEETSKR